jgi:hypothetical protein
MAAAAADTQAPINGPAAIGIRARVIFQKWTNGAFNFYFGNLLGPKFKINFSDAWAP